MPHGHAWKRRSALPSTGPHDHPSTRVFPRKLVHFVFCHTPSVGQSFTGLGTTLDSFNYQYDHADRVSQETSTLGPARNYTYDAAGQLLTDGTPNNYTYDLSGNRTLSGYQTTTGNELQTAKVDNINWTYSYDDEGNETKKSQGPTAETWKYGYDNLNHLVQAQKYSADPDVQGSGASLQLEVDFKYDAVGERI